MPIPPSAMFTCFAYSSSGTPNLLAIATCDGVSFTVFLRPVGAWTFRRCHSLSRFCSFCRITFHLSKFMREFKSYSLVYFRHSIRQLLGSISFFLYKSLMQVKCRVSHCGIAYQTMNFLMPNLQL
jgi:hypothetical protein